jgi:hypothetical protein
MADNARPQYGLMLWQGEQVDVIEKAMSSHHWKEFCLLVRDLAGQQGVYFEAGAYVATRLAEVRNTHTHTHTHTHTRTHTRHK